MKWGCREAFYGGPVWQAHRIAVNNGLITSETTIYISHTLERVTIVDCGDSWTGWRCQWCGERFQLPGEVARYDLPLMEDVETEELPSDDHEAAAVILAACASTPAEMDEVGDAIGSVLDRSVDIAIAMFGMVRLGDFALMGEVDGEIQKGNWASYFAMAESLIRTGEVTP